MTIILVPHSIIRITRTITTRVMSILITKTTGTIAKSANAFLMA